MSKNKNHKGLLKRIRISATGKVRHRSANHKHLRSGKGGKRLRHLRKDPYISNADAKRLEKLLFRRLRGRDQPRTALRRSPNPAERAAAKAAKAAAMAGTAAPVAVAASAKSSAKTSMKSAAPAKVVAKAPAKVAASASAKAPAKAKKS